MNTNQISGRLLADRFLYSLYRISGGNRVSIQPMDWLRCLNELEVSEATKRDVKDRLLADGLIELPLITTEALRLTFTGMDRAAGISAALSLQTEGLKIDAPLPSTVIGVQTEIDYWVAHLTDGQVGSDFWHQVESRLRNLRHKEMTLKEDLKGAVPRESKLLVFLSHSSNDAKLAKALIELLIHALGLVAEQIRCSSVDGYRLPIGSQTEDQLRNEVNITPVFIGLITPSSLQSDFVMFELGARWGVGQHLAPLLAGVAPGELRRPLSLLNALSAENESQLHQMIGDIARQLNRSVQNASAYSAKLQDVRQIAELTVSKFSAAIPQKPKFQRIAGHTYVEGDDEEICSRCADADCKPIHLVDRYEKGRPMGATCPVCLTSGSKWPPVNRVKAEDNERSRANDQVRFKPI